MSMRARVAVVVTAFVSALSTLVPVHGLAPQTETAGFTPEQIFSYPFPNQLAAASKAGRIAWALNEQGRRNIWVAEAPSFTARQLTSYSEDDGQELTGVSLSPGGEWVVYARGGDHGSNWDDTEPVNPLSRPTPPRVELWSVPFAGGEPRALGEGSAPVISPRGDLVAFEKGREIWVAPIDGAQPARRIIATAGASTDAAWAPDGSRLAFVSGRGDHAFIGVYRDERTPVTWMAPSTARDSSPRWSPDGSRLAFVRRPGRGGQPQPILEPRHQPWSLWTADAATGEATLLWKAPDTLRGSFPTTHGNANLHWAAKRRIVFLSYVDGWPHLYSVPERGGEPMLLTPGGYMAEHVTLSPDGTHLVFSANAGDAPDDLHRRHVVKVPVDRSTPEVMTPGTGVEWTPVVTGGGEHLAFIAATAQQPPLAAVMPLSGGPVRRLAVDRIPGDFPADRLVVPRSVTYQASDGLTVRAQLFDAPRADVPPAAPKRPAIVYVHGGPPRQMLLGWHYSDYYSRAYAMNQYLASRGFVVLSVNFRLGIGYGYDFHHPRAAGARGASEYLDVKAAAEYLRTLPKVDGSRIGIYGGSYGGYLTALALARDSALFAAGVDIHGVHDFTNRGSGSGSALLTALAEASRIEKGDRERALEVAWQSSPVSSIGTWTSPVLLIHGDDDRNVRFSQTVDLVRRLEAAGVRYEEIVVPDDTHHWMRHANALKVHAATAAFFERVFAASDR